MNIMLFSNGKLPHQTQLLEYGLDWIKTEIQKNNVKKFIFIPYAMIRSDYDARAEQLNSLFADLGCQVTSIHHEADPHQAIEDCDGIIVSGGNTWVLNKMLHDQGLIGVLRKAILKNNKLYIGWSAGANIGAPTIRTTNDMPIVTSAVLPSLNLVPFQINPHYIDASIDGHMGETRDERIEEFLRVNPKEIVVGIPEGSVLHVIDGHIEYRSANEKNMKLFQLDKEPVNFQSGDDIQFLMEHGY